MKNKVRLIDFNIVSSYMGRFLTAIVAVLVFAITISALVSEGGRRAHRTLIVGVADIGAEQQTTDYFEPFRVMVAGETGRKVVMRPLDSAHDDGCELYLLSVEDFLDRENDENLAPVCAVSPLDKGKDSAVLVSRHGWDSSRIPRLDPNDVIFSDTNSLNGFWLQFRWLEARGFKAPRDLGSLSFVSSPNRASRVLIEVLMGRYRLGACRRSDFADLVERGGAGESDFSVVNSIPALPERLIACRKTDLDYFAVLFRRIAGRLAASEQSAPGDETAALVKTRGMRSLRPVTAEELALVSEMLDQKQNRNKKDAR